MKKPSCHLHGEVRFVQTEIPDDAVEDTSIFRREPATGGFVVADSETTGNHHLVMPNKALKFFTTPDRKRRFMRCGSPTQVRCVLTERHDEITLPVGDYDVAPQEGFNYMTMTREAVRD